MSSDESVKNLSSNFNNIYVICTLEVGSNWPRTNRRTMQLFPTPESPNRTSCRDDGEKMMSARYEIFLLRLLFTFLWNIIARVQSLTLPSQRAYHDKIILVSCQDDITPRRHVQ